jgi:hypothetical protein
MKTITFCSHDKKFFLETKLLKLNKEQFCLKLGKKFALEILNLNNTCIDIFAIFGCFVAEFFKVKKL